VTLTCERAESTLISFDSDAADVAALCTYFLTPTINGSVPIVPPI